MDTIVVTIETIDCPECDNPLEFDRGGPDTAQTIELTCWCSTCMG